MKKIFETIKMGILIFLMLLGIGLLTSTKKPEAGGFDVETIRHNGRTYDVFIRGGDVEVVLIK